ncbi:SAM-dependent methyltransferase [Luteolibacter ambystomatis]|uniref:SAM-dependent methyltransferase n=1 Tax=Luteolibacter ambystomatis TaxID=2824561 RepID=A0A975J2B2_9BACT|nr:SAM-dependent methyltransferase [Luteolibacter ambystomatis]QUE52709.1 SAM-dependent methyltransferase [Luteolibacter ambystomatis]
MASLLADRIAREGPVSFADFTAAALYDPIRGYYARETRQVGRGGDFFTSVSVGPVFGTLLARRFLNWWHRAGQPDRWRITELGAHDGTLAGDVLDALLAMDARAFGTVEYAIIEPLPTLAAAQSAALARFAGHYRTVREVTELAPLPGMVFGNELLDALPFHVIERHGGSWHESMVTISNDGFQWDASSQWGGPVPETSAPLPDGYRTEIRTNYRELLEPLARTLDHGLMLWIDYGFARPEYYLPERTRGTLRTFSRHRAGDDPLDSPGERDITAHVDFTAVAETALALGMTPCEFRDQGAWLTRLAGPWLQEQEQQPDPAAIRQFQTLIHPAHLGARFHALELAVREPVEESARTQAVARLALAPLQRS